jgi:hypothetical protein
MYHALEPMNATIHPLPLPASQSASFDLDLRCDRALPLFTAEGERFWVPGWEPEHLSGGDQRGGAFRTRSADGAPTLWLVTERGDRHVAYARVTPDSHMGLVDVRCEPLGASRCSVCVRYTLTALSTGGRDYIEQFFAPGRYEAFIAGWKEALDTALAATPPASAS